jgi:ribonuclease HII
MRVLGIDEAGRGCVLGPLVVAGFLAEVDDDALLAAGAADSKSLSAARREERREALASLGQPDVREITASDIDAGNLNKLEEDVIVDLIRTWRPDHVIIDALGHPKTLPATMTRLLSQLTDLDPTPTIVMEPKADANHPPVGAASIFAKTHRDARIAALRESHGDFGSGYPSDPKTRGWLVEVAATGADWPSFVRTRWSTVSTIAQQVLFRDGSP